MATTLINQGGIDFTVETGVKTHQGWGKKYTNLNNILSDGVYDPDPQNIKQSINAIEIDWNGAEVDENTVLNTTGDLLTWIKAKTEIELPETDLSNYYQKDEVYSKEEIDNAGYLTEAPKTDLSNYYQKDEVYSKEEIDNAGYLTEAPETDLSNYYQKEEIDIKVTELEAADATLAGLIDEIKNESGVQGPQGPQGDKGEAGTKGVQGVQGAMGVQGPAGVQGTTGNMGVQGVQGAMGPQGEMGPQGVAGTFDTEVLETYATKDFVGEKIAEVVGAAPEALDTLKEIADKLGDSDDAVSALTTEIASKANTGDSYTKEESDNKYLTEHQSLEGYATETYVDDKFSQIVGTAPQNFDTLEELAAVMEDLKVVDVEAVPAVEGEHFTQEEIDAAQEGDEAYGKTVDDWKVEPVEGVEEQSHNMTITEFVNTSMQSVDEKEEVAKLQTKYNALLTLLNLRETDVNNVMLNEELENNTTVTFDEPVDNIVIPETTKTYKVTAPLDDNTTINLTSSKAATIINTADNTPNITINAPEVEGATSQAPNVSLQGNFDTLTLENISVTNTSAGLLAPVVPITVNNVIISENNTRKVRVNAAFNDGATVTNNSNSEVILQNMNSEDPTDVTIIAPNSTATLYGTWNTVNATVGDNTLIINPAVRIDTLVVKRGNVLVKSAYVSDCITNVVNDPINYTEAPQNESGLWTVEALTNEVGDLAAFKKVASTPSIVKFTNDIQNTSAITYGITTNGHIVYDLDGHTYSTTGTGNSAVILARGSNLTLDITGGGSIIGPNNVNSYGIWLRAATSNYTPVLNIYDCTVMGATHTLYAESGIINVYGGTFKMYDFESTEKDVNGNFKFLLNCLDANYQNGTARINVYGGKFWDFNPAEAYGEPGSPVSYVPEEGYEVIMTTVVENDVEHKVYEVRQISQ